MNMKIYHGSLEVVEHPKILHPNRKLDYGEGFYTTTSEKQAREWVERRMIENHSTCGYVNMYEFDDGMLPEFKSLIFSEPDEDWYCWYLIFSTITFWKIRYRRCM